MKVDQRKKVSAFKKDFKKEFGVGIRVYKGRHLADDVALKSLTEKGAKGGSIDFGGNTKVKNVEKIFREIVFPPKIIPGVRKNHQKKDFELL